MESTAVDDIPQRTTIAKNCWKTHKVRVDPEKHTYTQLADLWARLQIANKLRCECNLIVSWSKHTPEQMREMMQDYLVGLD
jgi:hypothetical protein